jgi:hypothetical protein
MEGSPSVWPGAVASALPRHKIFRRHTNSSLEALTDRSRLRAKVCAAPFATANTKIKNHDSIGDKVTQLILLGFFDFSAPRIGNSSSNIEAKSTRTSAGTSDRLTVCGRAMSARLAGGDAPARHIG